MARWDSALAPAECQERTGGGRLRGEIRELRWLAEEVMPRAGERRRDSLTRLSTRILARMISR